MDMENNMTKVMIQIDGETIEANAQQVAYIESWKEDIANEKAAKDKAADDKAAERQAVYAKLGITADEAKLLLS